MMTPNFSPAYGTNQVLRVVNEAKRESKSTVSAEKVEGTCNGRPVPDGARAAEGESRHSALLREEPITRLLHDDDDSKD